MSDSATEEPSDEELMRRVSHGDRIAFAELATRHRGRIMRLAYNVVRNRTAAEDIVQESFMRVWTRATDWDQTKGAFLPWLYRIATNLAIDQKRRPVLDMLDENFEVASELPDAETELSARQIARRIDQAVLKLPERQRQAVALCQFEHMSNIEAADRMAVSVGTLEQLLVRARRTLRRELADLMEDRP